ncbi:FecR family protein [Formosa haliotis]|uniref:FecR family protein n=1 Tax=Formosa haliotis TaxID=1555194 RepID=UPI0008251805|nr:FecR family protein [Formosa haliotis]
MTIPRGGQYHLVLSDNTEVWLNSESQLKYPVNFIEGKVREVELVYGEAYFEVSPSVKNGGAKFKVRVKLQVIEVFGTEFNVKSYKDESKTYTTLVHGKVAINLDTKSYPLLPNYQAVLSNEDNLINFERVDVYSETSWKDGVFSFRNKSLMEVMKVLSRWYDIDVIFENQDLKRKKFKGVLGKNQNIEEILLILKSSGSLKSYEINEEVIILK